MYGLEDTEVEQIRGVLSRFPQIDGAILYGSRAKGNFKPGSDVDLTLEGTELSVQLLNEVAWALDDLLLPYQVDLSILEQIDNQDLIEHIERVGVKLYTRPD